MQSSYRSWQILNFCKRNEGTPGHVWSPRDHPHLPVWHLFLPDLPRPLQWCLHDYLSQLSFLASSEAASCMPEPEGMTFLISRIQCRMKSSLYFCKFLLMTMQWHGASFSCARQSMVLLTNKPLNLPKRLCWVLIYHCIILATRNTKVRLPFTGHLPSWVRWLAFFFCSFVGSSCNRKQSLNKASGGVPLWSPWANILRHLTWFWTQHQKAQRRLHWSRTLGWSRRLFQDCLGIRFQKVSSFTDHLCKAIPSNPRALLGKRWS